MNSFILCKEGDIINLKVGLVYTMENLENSTLLLWAVVVRIGWRVVDKHPS